jgi:hypothetical protein
VECIATVPPYLEQLASNSNLLESAVGGGVETIFYAGGVISNAAGDAVSARLKHFNTCG